MILAISEFGGSSDILVMKVFLDLKLVIDSFVFQVDSSHEIRATFAPSVIRSVVIFFIIKVIITNILFTKTSGYIEFQTKQMNAAGDALSLRRKGRICMYTQIS